MEIWAPDASESGESTAYLRGPHALCGTESAEMNARLMGGACAAVLALAMGCNPSTDMKTDYVTQASELPTPPDEAKKPHTSDIHGLQLQDDYFWMRLSDAQKEAKQSDAQTEEVVAYLEAENAYTKTVMAPTEALQTKIYDEIVGRIKKDDESVPVLDKGYWYYSRYEEGKETPSPAARRAPWTRRKK